MLTEIWRRKGKYVLVAEIRKCPDCPSDSTCLINGFKERVQKLKGDIIQVGKSAKASGLTQGNTELIAIDTVGAIGASVEFRCRKGEFLNDAGGSVKLSKAKNDRSED